MLDKILIEVLKRVTEGHYLTAMKCDHEAKTDVAVCWCMWTSSPQPCVGDAVKEFADHVAEKYEAELRDTLEDDLGEVISSTFIDLQDGDTMTPSQWKRIARAALDHMEWL